MPLKCEVNWGEAKRLKRHFMYKEKLVPLFIGAQDNPRYKFYGCSWMTFIEEDKDDWCSMRKVSVDKDGNILGYMSAGIYREKNYITNLGLINFTGNLNITFSKDFKQFFDDLFTKYNFEKINWYVLIGNPAEEMYDKIAKKYGGRIVGTFKKGSFNAQRELCDEKHYEIFKEDYLKAICNDKSTQFK